MMLISFLGTYTYLKFDWALIIFKAELKITI